MEGKESKLAEREREREDVRGRAYEKEGTNPICVMSTRKAKASVATVAAAGIFVKFFTINFTNVCEHKLVPCSKKHTRLLSKVVRYQSEQLYFTGPCFGWSV